MKLSAQGNYTLISDYTLSSGNFYTLLRLYSELRQLLHYSDYILSSGNFYTQVDSNQIKLSAQIILSAQATFTLSSGQSDSTHALLSAQEAFTLNPYYTISSGNFNTLLRLYSQLMHIEYTVLYIHADLSAHRFYSEAITLSSGLLQLSFHATL
jgi:hypothetical protein